MHHIVDIIVGLVEWMGYIGIFIMMMIESSFIPFPSEVAMIPAGWLVAQWKMSLLLVFVAGTLWALVWASINYFGGKYLGRPVVRSLIHKYGKYILLNEKHYEKSEQYFADHGAITTLVGRFIPAVRQLISIPAGIFHMEYKKFLIYTAIGAGTWNAILIAIGYIAWKNEDLIKKLTSEVFLGILLILGIIIFLYIQYVKRNAKKLRKIEKTIEHNNELAYEKAHKKDKKKHHKQ